MLWYGTPKRIENMTFRDLFVPSDHQLKKEKVNDYQLLASQTWFAATAVAVFVFVVEDEQIIGLQFTMMMMMIETELVATIFIQNKLYRIGNTFVSLQFIQELDQKQKNKILIVKKVVDA